MAFTEPYQLADFTTHGFFPELSSSVSFVERDVGTSTAEDSWVLRKRNKYVEDSEIGGEVEPGKRVGWAEMDERKDGMRNSGTL